MRKGMWAWLALGVVSAISSSTLTADAQELTLARNGKTTYRIVLSQDAIPAEQTAAKELAEHLQKVTGATYAVSAENETDPKAAQILVGSGPRVKVLLPNQDWKKLGPDGIVIKTVGNKLVLAGGRPRGTLYAVNQFLEDAVGVRWWTPTESTIPSRPTLVVGKQNVEYVPQILTREGFYSSVQADPLFATRMKNNGEHQQQDATLGGHNSILGFVHTFDKLLPPEKYFKDHPEWYSDPENENKPCTAASRMPEPQQSQLCLTNEEARRELTKNALEWIRKNPEAGMISISQNDNFRRCMAPADVALEEKEGSPAGPLLHFVNAVAADIEKEYPDFLVETLAYLYTRKAPKFVRPRRNVVIRLCSIEADFSRPLNSDANADFRDDVLAWKAIAPRLYIWDYVTNFGNVILPHPNIPVLGSNVRFFAANNTIGLFEQGDAYSNGTGDFVALRVWLLSHLMWNPSLDQKKLEDEFLNGYYGAAAPFLRTYLDAIPAAFAKKGGKLSTFNSDHSYLDLDVMNKSTVAFRQAAAAVANDPVLSKRVRRERLALDHAWLLRNNALRREARSRNVKLEAPDDMEVFANDFVKTAREFGTRNYRETNTFESYVPQLLARFGPNAALPDFVKDKDVANVIDAQEYEFNIYRLGDLVNIVDDPKASNGRAAQITGNTNEWAIQFPISEGDEYMTKTRWHCYMVAKVQPKAGVTTGAAFGVGIYDYKNKVTPLSLSKTLEETDSGEYKTFDLGVHPLHASMYFWLAPPFREDIESISVDRFILVREP